MENYYELIINEGIFCNKSQILSIICNNIVLEKDNNNILNKYLINDVFLIIKNNFKNLDIKLIIGDKKLNIKLFDCSINKNLIYFNILINNDFKYIPYSLKNNILRVFYVDLDSYNLVKYFISKNMNNSLTINNYNSNDDIQNKSNIRENKLSKLEKYILTLDKKIYELENKVSNSENCISELENKVSKIESILNTCNERDIDICNEFKKKYIYIEDSISQNNSFIKQNSDKISYFENNLKELISIIDDSKNIIYENSRAISEL